MFLSRIDSMKRTMEYRTMVDVLMSEERYADLVLAGGTIVNEEIGRASCRERV